MSKIIDKDTIKKLNLHLGEAMDTGYAKLHFNEISNLIELYNRQEIEIESLKQVDVIKEAEIEKLNVELVGMRGACNSYKMHYDNAKVEIERLQNKTKEQSKTITSLIAEYENLCSDYAIAGVEAIKEFVDKLKATPMRFSVKYVKYYDKPPIEKMVLFIDDNDLDNLVKEWSDTK